MDPQQEQTPENQFDRVRIIRTSARTPPTGPEYLKVAPVREGTLLFQRAT